MSSCLSLLSIRQWLQVHQKRLRAGDGLPTVTEIADRAGISRQSIYNILSNDRSQFGDAVQIRLSRVIQQIDAEAGSNKSNLLCVSVGQTGPARLFVGPRYHNLFSKGWT